MIDAEKTRRISPILWGSVAILLIGLVALFLYTSGISGVEPSVPATQSLEPPRAAISNTSSIAPKRDKEKVTILTEDDRPGRLLSTTSGWGTDWKRHTIDYNEIFSGGPPRDGIPSIDEPKFVDAAAASEWLAGNEPVIALEIDGVRARIRCRF